MSGLRQNYYLVQNQAERVPDELHIRLLARPVTQTPACLETIRVLVTVTGSESPQFLAHVLRMTQGPLSAASTGSSGQHQVREIAPSPASSAIVPDVVVHSNSLQSLEFPNWATIDRPKPQAFCSDRHLRTSPPLPGSVFRPSFVLWFQCRPPFFLEVDAQRSPIQSSGRIPLSIHSIPCSTKYRTRQH